MKPKPFDALKMAINTMVNLGYIRPLPEPASARARRAHQLLRGLMFLMLVSYNLQHTIFIFQVDGNVDLIVASLFTLLVTLNVTSKLVAFNRHGHRFDRLREILDGPTLDARCARDEELLQTHIDLMTRLTRNVQRTVCVNTVLWFITPFANKLMDENAVVPSYFPFETKSFTGYALAVIYDSTIMFWVGFGHMTANVFISGLYGQSCIQLKIIRYHLEHIADVEEGDNVVGNSPYIDENNKNVKARFVHYIQRYDTVIQYTKELESIMSQPLLVQFFASGGVICMVVFKMSILTTKFTIEFAYQIVYLSCLLAEVFLYCYFGTLVENESQFVNESLYLSDWPALSPRFRRQLLVGMTRWVRPITPLAANLVPLSLYTFIRVIRSAYTLYTFLKA